MMGHPQNYIIFYGFSPHPVQCVSRVVDQFTTGWEILWSILFYSSTQKITKCINISNFPPKKYDAHQWQNATLQSALSCVLLARKQYYSCKLLISLPPAYCQTWPYQLLLLRSPITRRMPKTQNVGLSPISPTKRGTGVICPIIHTKAHGLCSERANGDMYMNCFLYGKPRYL